MWFEIDKNCKIISNDKVYVYKEIIENVQKIRGQLPLDEKRIGICMDHDEYVMFSAIALMESNITYIPISNMDPVDRVEYILEDCGIKTVITDENNSDKFQNFRRIDVKRVSRNSCICINETVGKNSSGDDYAYILYTSGTTGRPKGVAITRDNLSAFLDGVQNEIHYSNDTVMLYHTAYTFDISFLESMAVLAHGGTVVVANNDEYTNIKSLLGIIEKQNINTLQITPSKLGLFIKLDSALSFLNSVKLLMVGGEVFPANLLHKLQEKREKDNLTLTILNMYGPTETTIWSTISDLTHKARVDVGFPIKNAEIYILDEDKNVLDKNLEGEIFIAGSVVGAKYIHNNLLTESKFTHILVNGRKIRGFLTGDNGKINEEGALECYNRKDSQVKINGVRIELEEIESIMQDFLVGKCCAVIKMERFDSSDLLVCISDKDIDVDGLQQYLRGKLPQYMVPNLYCFVGEIPYTTSAKLDRKKLTEMCKDTQLLSLSHKEEKESAKQKKCDELWNKLIQIISSAVEDDTVSISPHDSLTTVGINSISFINIIVSAEEEFNIEFDENKLVVSEFPTFKDLLAYVRIKIDESKKTGGCHGE